MTTPHPLRHLEELEERLNNQSGYTGTARWMIPYADFLTILLGFFLVLFAMVKMENQTLATEAEKALSSLGAAQQQAQEASQKLTLLIEHLKKQNLDPNKLIEAATQRAAMVQAQQTDATLEDLEESLLRELKLSGQQVTVSQDGRGLVISFQERIFFAPGEAKLSSPAEKTLDQLSEVLKKTRHPIRVEGHTDNTPIKTTQFPSNWELSTARSTTIVKSLIEKHGFPPKRLSAAGYGEFYPLADNSTIEGKQKNRRVDIVLLNPLSGLSTAGSDKTSSPPKKPAP